MAGKMIAVLRLVVAGVFLYAGTMKIWDFAQMRSATPDFTIAIQNFRILPSPDLAVLLAVYLPWLEVAAALALFLRRLALGAATASLGLSAVFLGAVGSAWWRGLDIACGCFGKENAPTDFRFLLLRNTALLATTAILFFHESRRPSPTPPHP